MSGDAGTMYSLAETRRSVNELYPVLLDAHGNLIDGNSRLDAAPGWRTETRENIRTRSQLWLARIVANSCRRVVSREERAEQITELAKSLTEEGVPRTDMVSTVSRLTTFSDRYVRELLPDTYKRGYTAPGKSELSSEYEDLAKRDEFAEALSVLGVKVPVEPQPREAAPAHTGPSEDRGGGAATDEGTPGPQAGSEETPQLPESVPGAPADPTSREVQSLVVPTAPRPEADATVAHDAEMQSGTPEPETPTPAEGGALGPAEGEPREEALAHIRRFFDEHPEPDEEYLAWEVAIKHGVPTKEGRELIDLVKRERGIETEPKLRSQEAPGEVTCPLCSRGGASREEILGRVRDSAVGQLTLWEFVMEEMR